eukprot:5919531-Pleurochrysis_carterae.AAC.1
MLIHIACFQQSRCAERLDLSHLYCQSTGCRPLAGTRLADPVADARPRLRTPPLLRQADGRHRPSRDSNLVLAYRASTQLKQTRLVVHALLIERPLAQVRGEQSEVLVQESPLRSEYRRYITEYTSERPVVQNPAYHIVRVHDVQPIAETNGVFVSGAARPVYRDALVGVDRRYAVGPSPPLHFRDFHLGV